MTLIWSPEAEADRLAIFRATCAESVFAADALDVLFEESAERLAAAPEQGKPCAMPGVRELGVHPSYSMIYTVSGPDLQILAIANLRRQWPPAS